LERGKDKERVRTFEARKGRQEGGVPPQTKEIYKTETRPKTDFSDEGLLSGPKKSLKIQKLQVRLQKRSKRGVAREGTPKKR